MPGDGCRSIPAILMQMGEAGTGRGSPEKSDVSAELFLYRIFFKDFNKARAAFAKGVRTKKTQLHLGAERKSWGAAAISWAGGDNRDSGAENGRIFLQIFDAFG